MSLPLRPIVLRSGWIVVPPERYFPGSALGKETEPAALEARVREVAAHGLAWFKVIADFPGSDMDLFAAPLTFPLETLRAAVEVAHALGVRVMAHSTGPAVADLVECGVDAIEHGCSIEPAVVDRMAARGIAWTPTLATVEAHLRQAEAFGVSTAPRTAWTERMQRTLSAAVRAGVSVLVGTDELPHGSFVREMEVMVRLGLTPTEAVAAATTTARRFLGLSVIELGAPADVVTYHHDPRLDLATIARPAAVIAAGRMLDLGRPSDAAEGAHG